MKITITRSFSKKVQIKQFEPIDSFCSATEEYEVSAITDKVLSDMREVSSELDEFCREEVEKTLAIIRPPLKKNIVGKSKAERKDDGELEEFGS